MAQSEVNKMVKAQQSYSVEQIEQMTRLWVETMVVGLNLCPFAAPVVKDETLRFAITDADNDAALTRAFLAEVERLLAADEQTISTTLFIVPTGLEDFYDYLDHLRLFESLLQQAGLEGVLQLASFHPGYLFAGVAADDLSHWSNRAPWPTFHLIREAEVSRALAHYAHPEQIPERNIKRLRALGRDALIARFPPFADYC
ncbi:DUF1415 domain-containing protein [Amphritea sp. 1_MG-2023]|uniref:DUF1415 domain-containing protein n=1 Tax=Amphritea sp. 1_MG-2023 TaxID=3062670 RepID=UPI0026E19116|nr:DUF1415 domain-containing protein [Amphritea sp. 1_MG-2023]MDO6562431.1 DUF1415 domain-containing protein [Amphritea sp. 1_MG-2023]